MNYYHRGRMILCLVVLVIALGFVSCAGPAEPPQPSVQPTPISKASTGNVVSAEAAIVPCKQAGLSFKATGYLQELLVSEGDQVTAGQELAKLDTRDLQQAVLKAEANLKSAQAKLTEVKTGARSEELAAAEATVAIAEAEAKAAEVAIKIAESTVQAAQAAAEKAQADAKSAKSAELVARGNLASAQAALQTAQANLSKTLAGATPLEIQIAERRVELARNQLWGYQGERDALGGSGNQGAYEAAKGRAAAAESEVAIAMLELEKLKAGPKPEDVEIARANVAEAESKVGVAQAQLLQAQNTAEGAAAQALEAQARVQAAKAELDQRKNQHEGAKARVEQAKAQRDLLKAGRRPEEIATAEVAVMQAEAALMEARNALTDAVLRAPFAGTVAEIAAEKGELVAPQMVVIRLGDLSCLRVETRDLNEFDVARVSPGQSATVTVDALKEGTFKGTVSQVALVAKDLRGDKVYKVIVNLPDKPKSELRWGMTAFVRIQVR